ncbi:MAG: formate transporter FocA, partial [Nitrospiraceae bacterium]
AIRIARAKSSLGMVEAVARGMLCNVLVCPAVWLGTDARGGVDKILAIVFPISAFVASGFEPSVATMCFLPIGLALTWTAASPIMSMDVIENLVLVTIGSLLGPLVRLSAEQRCLGPIFQ